MSPKDNLSESFTGARSSARAHCVCDISVTNEGHDELIRIKAPDLSCTGMFITSTRTFPEGTVLNLKFRLAVTGVEVLTRCEVRYCHPGIGIGVEFIGLSSEAARDIEAELALSQETSKQKKQSPHRPRSRRR